MSIVAYFRQFDIDCMLRPSNRSRTQLYRYLEEGVTGFLVPFVDDAESARELVSGVKFPPLGNRVCGRLWFRDGFRPETIHGPAALYPADANHENFIFAKSRHLRQ